MAAIAIGATCVLALLILGNAVSSGSTAQTIAANAYSLHWANSVLGSAGLARAANAQAVVFAVDRKLGVASHAALEAAVVEARTALDYLEARIELWPTEDAVMLPDMDAALGAFLEIDREILLDIESGNIPEAVELSHGQFEVAYRTLEQMLDKEQSRIINTIDDTETALGRMASIVNVVITLLIPGTAMTIYFLFARRQIRERRLSMEYQVQAARELSESKDEFIASVSHELRTPLTSIYGFSEVLLGAGVLDPRQARELITIINSESGELMRMVEDLLTGARLDSGALIFDLTDVDVLREIEMVVEPLRRTGLDMTVACAPAYVLADPMRFRQVIRNLISNAQKHGGPKIAIGSQVRGDKLVLAVVDDGSGVPLEIEGRLFERFVHDGPHAILAGSVGLGLAIARTLTEGMGGVLQYERIDGHTVFSLTMPLSPSSQPPARPAEIGVPTRTRHESTLFITSGSTS